MTDKELLKLAAKAHGGLIYIDDMGWIHEDKYGNRGTWWNPLENDGDAFILALQLDIRIDPLFLGEIVVAEVFPHVAYADIELFGGDKNKAARYAIVRVAAKIGDEET